MRPTRHFRLRSGRFNASSTHPPCETRQGASLAKNRASCRCSSFQKYISLSRNESHNYEIFEQPVIRAFSYVIHSQSIRIDALFEDLKDTWRDAGLFSTYPQFLMRISALLLHPHRNTPYYGCFVRLSTEFHAHIYPPTTPNRQAEERLTIWILQTYPQRPK